MASLSEVSTPHPVGDGYRLDVAPEWRHGRGAFGGLVIGALLRAIEQRTADPTRKVRSVTAELPGAVEPGTANITVEILRQGKNVSTVRAALSQDGEIRSHAVAILAASRSSAEAVAWNELPRPEAPAWNRVEPIHFPVHSGPRSEFVDHFEFRVIEGMALSGGAGRALGWVRPRDPGAPRDAAYIAAMIDAWWPVAFIRFTRMRLMTTIAFTLNIVADLDGLDPMAPLLYRATAPVCGDGYCLENRELWGEDGRLVATNQQTFAIISIAP